MTTSTTSLEDIVRSFGGTGETVGLSIPREQKFSLVARPGFRLKGDKFEVIPSHWAVDITGPILVEATLQHPLTIWVGRVRQAALDIIGEGALVTLARKRWEDGSPYVAVTAEAPVASTAAAMTMEETLLDWVIDNVPDFLRDNLVVSVRRSH